MLSTEAPSDEHPDLDLYDTARLVRAFADDQAHAVAAVQAAAGRIAEAVQAALPRVEAGGRLLYAGAGTSGRLGVLDSVELFPTFSWPPERARAVVAGGRRAMFQAVEGAEDRRDHGVRDMAALQPGARDVALLVAASGTTPYVLGALQAAAEAGALTIGFANNPGTPVLVQAELGILLATGPELISGSTRLKAGTAQKIALNTFSSALMVRLNKVYGNLMVDVQPTNAKLSDRALRLTMRAAGCDEATARAALQACGYSVKTAIVALLGGLSAAQAEARLAAAAGNVRTALAPPP